MNDEMFDPNKINRKKVIERDPKTGRIRVYTLNDEPSMTDQSQADACEVNNIIAKFNKTGELSHVKAHQGVYADVSEFPDLHEAMSQVRTAQYAFETLPADLRAKFNNDPLNFYSYLQDPHNDVEAVNLGLKEWKQRSPSPNFQIREDASASARAKSSNKNKKAQNDDESNDDE